MPAKNRLRWGIRFVGYALVILAFAYLGRVLFDHLDAVRRLEIGASYWLAAAGGGIVYTTVLLSLAASWTLLVLGRTRKRRRFSRLVGIYGRTGLAKYVPGNIFHLVGRQFLGAAIGVSHLRIAVASGLEVAFSVLSALTIAGAILLISSGSLDLRAEIWAAGAAVGGVLLVTLLIRPLLRLFPSAQRLIGEMADLPIFKACGLNLLGFFVLAVLAGVSAQTVISSSPGIARIGAIYLLAWLTGYLVPGASGGIGVREAVTVAQLAPDYGEAPALAFAILMRLQSILGDVLSFVISVGLDRRSSGYQDHLG